MTTTGSLSGLIEFIDRTAWADALGEVLAQHLGPTCLSARVKPDEIGEVLGSHVAGTLWGCALEDLMARDYADGRNVVDEYLHHRGNTESAASKRYMKALRDAVMSLYEVSGVEPGVAFLARDLIRGGDPVRVLEKSATRMLKAWDRISARLVRLGSEWRMGGGVLLFDRNASAFLIEELKKLQAGKLPDNLRERGHRLFGKMLTAEAERDLAEGEPLRQLGPTFTGIWLADALARALNPRLPELSNTDGEPIVICSSVFRLQTGVKAAQCRKALARTPELHEASSKLVNWVRGAGDEPRQGARTRPRSKSGVTLSAMNSVGETLRGSIEIMRGAVVLSTNSRERAARGEVIIAAALQGLVDPPRREEMTAEEMLARGPDAAKGRTRRDAGAPVAPEDARGIIHAHLDMHYRKVIDEPIPVLGGRSPREAARTAAGRVTVVAWLKDIENHAAKADGAEPMASYDFGWLWRELGVEKLRA